MRRCLTFLLVLLPLSVVRADALTIRDVIELSKANVGDQVLLALIDVEHSVFTIDTPTLKLLKKSGVSEDVIIAMIRSGRTPDTNPSPILEPQNPEPQNSEQQDPEAQDPRTPQVVVIDHHDAPAPVYVPVGVPVFVSSVPAFRTEFVTRTVVTDDGGVVKVREPLPPNCTQAEPVYWGNGGKRRAGTWEPPVQVVCR